jgi:hypothetical protein
LKQLQYITTPRNISSLRITESGELAIYPTRLMGPRLPSPLFFFFCYLLIAATALSPFFSAALENTKVGENTKGEGTRGDARRAVPARCKRGEKGEDGAITAEMDARARFLLLDERCDKFHPLNLCSFAPSASGEGEGAGQAGDSGCVFPALEPLRRLLSTDAGLIISRAGVVNALEHMSGIQHGCPTGNTGVELAPSPMITLSPSNNGTTEDGLDSVSRLCALLISLQESVLAPRAEVFTKNGPSPRVLVAGGGPVGLIEALVAHTNGGEVTVFEQRTNYTRDVWFDLEPQPWGVGAEALERWGAHFSYFERMIHFPQHVPTIRTQVSKNVVLSFFFPLPFILLVLLLFFSVA